MILAPLAAFWLVDASKGCPYLTGGAAVEETVEETSWSHPAGYRASQQEAEEFRAAFDEIDFEEVKKDLIELFTTSQEHWPADYGHYGPFLIRLAWHSAGSYRVSDGRGGADGARMRFDPERSWPDNTNLEKAHALLQPIKVKYGKGLSWGDLVVLAGTTAIEHMGGPVVDGFCGGRVDDRDGFWSKHLGPSEEQEETAPCDNPGGCTHPLAPDMVGLIYVDAQGPHGVPDPVLAGKFIRSSFGRMGFDDRETVAIIGGGHAFGKCHAACPDGAGPNPKEQPDNPWPGNCGTGRGADTFTSGFEGAWTTTPITWNNEFFKLLFDHTWEKITVGAGIQWHATDVEVKGNRAHGEGKQEVLMLTTDLALIFDPIYRPIAEEFANDIDALNEAFSEAWYKLMARDMGPSNRCIGKRVPSARMWQHTLPQPSPLHTKVDWDAVKEKIGGLVANARPDFMRLAWSCASTFRVTDYQGGCNGARILLEPQRNWNQNHGLSAAAAMLMIARQSMPKGVSMSDLIVLAGNLAVEQASGRELPFCPGRVDLKEDGGLSELLAPLVDLGSMGANIAQFRDAFLRRGLTAAEAVALIGGGHSLGCMTWCSSYMAWFFTEQQDGEISNEYFQELLSNTWEASGKRYKIEGGEKRGPTILRIDYLITRDPETLAIAQKFASDNVLFLDTLVSAWTKIMIADRFDGPTGNVCTAATCGKTGKIRSRDKRVKNGNAKGPCACRDSCAKKNHAAFMFKPTRRNSGKCYCYQTFGRLAFSDKVDSLVGAVESHIPEAR